jgi:hypothetical protein
MSPLEVPRVCVQALEEPSPLDEEEALLSFEFVLIVGGSLLSSEPEVKKPLMEDYLDELDDLEVKEDLDTMCCLQEATLF